VLASYGLDEQQVIIAHRVFSATVPFGRRSPCLSLRSKAEHGLRPESAHDGVPKAPELEVVPFGSVCA
jgi:hypothetical protein